VGGVVPKSDERPMKPFDAGQKRIGAVEDALILYDRYASTQSGVDRHEGYKVLRRDFMRHSPDDTQRTLYLSVVDSAHWCTCVICVVI
jgi:hypothetical protein